MQIGLIGSGNMARAMARGWGEPVLCTDSGSGNAQALVDELGGERVASNRELAERADLVVLCHKPYQLDQVADEIRDGAKIVVSVLEIPGPGGPLQARAGFRPDAQHAGRDPPGGRCLRAARSPHD
jgi:predicted dinucleotide-binding enzyme